MSAIVILPGKPPVIGFFFKPLVLMNSSLSKKSFFKSPTVLEERLYCSFKKHVASHLSAETGSTSCQSTRPQTEGVSRETCLRAPSQRRLRFLCGYCSIVFAIIRTILLNMIQLNGPCLHIPPATRR